MNYRWLLQLIAGLALIIAASLAGRPEGVSASSARKVAGATQDSYQAIKIGKIEGAIVPAARGAEFLKALTGSEGKDYWTPAKADVQELEEKIEFYLRKTADRRSPALWSKLADYRRQYAGIVENGRRKIYANFFCNTAQIKNWKTVPVAVEDGGDCFFQIKYDVDAGTFSHLYINGDA